MIAYHVTKREHRDSILDVGLRAHDTTAPGGNFVSCGLPGNMGVRAVYGHAKYSGAVSWAELWHSPGECDVWEIDTAVEFDTDPHWGDALRFRGDIPSWELTLVTPPFTDQEDGRDW